MAGIEQFVKHYSLYNSSFKETSYDKEKNTHLCNDTTIDVINFDKIIEDIYPDSNTYRPKSFDALYQQGNDIYLIEFKNQKKSFLSTHKYDLEQKLLDGKNELDKLLNSLNIQKDNYNFKYCIVYKNCSVSHFDEYKCGIDKDVVKFGLGKYKNKIVEDIKTNEVDFFTKVLNKKLTPSTLKCEEKI